MHGASDQFLARACLAIDQHCGVGWRDCLNFAQDKLQSPAVSDDVLEMKLASDLAESKGAGMEFLKRTSALVWARGCKIASLLLKHVVIFFLDKLS